MSWRAKVSRNVSEITCWVCNDSASSAGYRAFILNNYPEIMMLNPTFDFLIREGSDNPEPTLEVFYHPEVVFTPGEKFGHKTLHPVIVSLDCTDKSEEDILAMFKEAVLAGAKTPQITSSVPKPIAIALCEDHHGHHSHDLWPGEALGYDFANFADRSSSQIRDLTKEEIAGFKADFSEAEFADFMKFRPKYDIKQPINKAA